MTQRLPAHAQGKPERENESQGGGVFSLCRAVGGRVAVRGPLLALGSNRNSSRATPYQFPFQIFHDGSGQAVVQPTGQSPSPSSGEGFTEGLIVVNSNGEGRGVPAAY